MLKVNEYFNGSVKSIAFQNNEGTSTVGVISAGEFEFSTSQNEVMTVISGRLDVLLPGSDGWRSINAGGSFSVGPGLSFRVKTDIETAYHCLYS